MVGNGGPHPKWEISSTRPLTFFLIASLFPYLHKVFLAENLDWDSRLLPQHFITATMGLLLHTTPVKSLRCSKHILGPTPFLVCRILLCVHRLWVWCRSLRLLCPTRTRKSRGRYKPGPCPDVIRFCRLVFPLEITQSDTIVLCLFNAKSTGACSWDHRYISFWDLVVHLKSFLHDVLDLITVKKDASP